MVRYTHPEMFYLFIPLTLVLIWYAYQGRKLRMGLEGLGTAPVKKFLLNRVKHSSIRLRSRLIILGIIFILLASVGPQIGMKLTELTRQGVDIFILMDTSTSMNAEDVKPSRMEKAKYELGRLLNNLEGDRVGLIAFAGSAHLHCPLTEDYSASHLFLNMMDTGLITNQGTDLAAAIQLALEYVEEETMKNSRYSFWYLMEKIIREKRFLLRNKLGIWALLSIPWVLGLLQADQFPFMMKKEIDRSSRKITEGMLSLVCLMNPHWMKSPKLRGGFIFVWKIR